MRSDIDDMMSRLSSYNMALAVLGVVTCVALYYSLILKSLPFWAPILVAASAVFVLQRRFACQRRLIRHWILAEYNMKRE